MKLRIVSLNAWGGQLWQPLAEWLPQVGADVLLLQEVTRAPVPSPPWLRYVDPFRDLAQRSNLFADVSRLLPRHLGHFAAAARGDLSDAAGRAVQSEHGLGAWIVPHLAVSESRAGFVHGAYRGNGWGDEPAARTALVFRLNIAEQGLVIAQFHGLRDPSGKGDTPARAAQARAMAALIGDLAQPGDEVVLAGDFNLLPQSASFATFAALGLSDLVTGRGHADTRTSHYAKPLRYADYLLVTPGLEVADFDVPAQPEVSDHRPLILDLVV